MALHEAQELAVLVADAADGDGLSEGAGQERVVLRPAERALGSGNWITVGIGRRTAEHLVDALDQPVGDGVLEMLGLVVHFGPAHTHHLHKEELDEPVAPQDACRELLASLGQPDAGVRFVPHEPRLSQSLHHRRGRSGDDPER